MQGKVLSRNQGAVIRMLARLRRSCESRSPRDPLPNTIAASMQLEGLFKWKTQRWTQAHIDTLCQYSAATEGQCLLGLRMPGPGPFLLRQDSSPSFRTTCRRMQRTRFRRRNTLASVGNLWNFTEICLPLGSSSYLITFSTTLRYPHVGRKPFLTYHVSWSLAGNPVSGL